jgi:bis(5'-nucleosyl)-tetraphosphatase (symmetrical)
MTTYAIGDVQGCLVELEKLLKQINFDNENDTLWFTGDLVNRGPYSLETLRFVKSLGKKHIIVLGNHDLHLLAVASGAAYLNPEDTLTEILQANDSVELLSWLSHRPLLHHDKTSQFVMVHAGLAPAWSLHTAKELAHEVETVLRGEAAGMLLKNMYGNQPDQWNDHLTGIERWRCIINYLTRMRFCRADGSLDLIYKGAVVSKPKDVVPWFETADRLNANEKIIFGHWAALGGKTHFPNLYPLDTGCVWGNCLTALRLEDEQRFSVKCA